jgi:hypothetical protein
MGKQRKKPCWSSVQRPEQHSMSSPVHGSNAGLHHVTFEQYPSVQTSEQHCSRLVQASPVGRQYGSRSQPLCWLQTDAQHSPSVLHCSPLP